jgi:hypothetical protein
MRTWILTFFSSCSMRKWRSVALRLIQLPSSHLLRCLKIISKKHQDRTIKMSYISWTAVVTPNSKQTYTITTPISLSLFLLLYIFPFQFACLPN